ncbi:hypothetical protein AAULR_13714 [Lacticaseibacillus rhamnosus MTCC 5462]|nr:hypothetical protein AAULR_13714 [Lacticaseibacillus rhamnosus MTCC 5462]
MHAFDANARLKTRKRNAKQDRCQRHWIGDDLKPQPEDQRKFNS